MPTSSKFPLLLLPLLVLNQVLKLMTPFELIAVSLCSKTSQKICKSIRTRAQCEKPGYLSEFSLCYSVIQEIRLSFYGTTDWGIYIKKMPPQRIKARGLWSRVKSVFRREKAVRELEEVMQGVYYSGIKIRKHPEKNERCLILRHSGDHVSATKNLILYLEDLFNITLKVLDLHIHPFDDEECYEIVDTFCSKPISDFQLSSRLIVGESKQELIHRLLNRQTASNNLYWYFDTTPEFKYDFTTLNTKFNRISIKYAQWMLLDDILNMEVQFLFLYETSFKATDLKKLLQEWINGWRPKWIAVKIQFCEDVELHNLIAEIRDEIVISENEENDEEARRTRFLGSVEIVERPDGIQHKIEYRIFRPNFISGIISMVNRREGGIQFYTQPEKSIFSETYDGTRYNLHI